MVKIFEIIVEEQLHKRQHSETLSEEQHPLTSHGAEGVEVFCGEQRIRQVPDELLEQRSGIVRAHFIPVEASRVEVGLQVLLQQLQTGNKLSGQGVSFSSFKMTSLHNYLKKMTGKIIQLMFFFKINQTLIFLD